LSRYERIIVLEDDMVTSPYFLSYMNEALDRFANDDRVISAHGYVYPVKQGLPEAFFLRGADCWGWATWRRGWELFNPNGQALLDELKRRNLIKVFNFNGAYGYSQMLESQIKGVNDSWAIRWYATAFLAEKLTLYPGRSLVNNIGNDSSGTHCGTTTALDAELSDRPININGVRVEEDSAAKETIENYFRSKTTRIKRAISQMIRRDTMRTLSRISKDWLPSAIDRRLRKLVRGGGIHFEGNFKTWGEAAVKCTGYDADSILDKVLDASLKVKNGDAVFERDSVLFDEIQYSWPVTAALMWAASRNGGNLHVLDFGGSLGSSYFQNRKFLSSLKNISWHVVEQPHFVDKGNVFISDDVIKFYSSIEESIKLALPNVILLSSVVQYVQDLDWLIDKINSVESDVLIFDRTPFTSASENSICIQHVPSHIYKASYPMWLLSREMLLGKLSKWKVLESFPSAEGRTISQAGIEFEFSGYILERIRD
jgi:putative methyltransferase (TIGR04325 family)